MLEARSLSYQVGEALLLDSVEMSAEPGHVTAIVGPNGAGKSTLLRLLAGFTRPSSGELLIDGTPISEINLAELARRRAYMSPTLPEQLDFSVEEVVRMGRHPWQTTRVDADDAVARSLETMEIAHLAAQSYSTLSTGEARRTQIARLLAQRTAVMLLDEPVSGLDIAYSELVLDRLNTTARDGRTVVAVLHDLNAAAQHAGRVVLLDAGRVVAAGKPAEVFTADMLSEVYRHPIKVVPHPERPGILVLAGQHSTN